MPPRAINRLRALLTEFKDTEHEAILQQHLGFAYVESGDLLAAANRFRKALDLRTAAGSDAHLIESSRACLESVLEQTGSAAGGSETPHPAAVNSADRPPAAPGISRAPEAGTGA